MALVAAGAISSPAVARRRAREADELRAWWWRLLALLLVAAAVFTARHYLLGDSAHPSSRVQRVRLVTPQRPPPPKAKDETPKPPEKPSEQERPNEKTTYQGQLALVENATPGPPGPPGERPLDDQLGVEAEGEGPGDSFGLVAKRGGHDITRLGSAGAGAGGGGITRLQQRMIFRGYGETVAQRLTQELQGSGEILAREYEVVTLVWIDVHGRIVRAELQRSTGSPDLDIALRRALASAPVLPEPPSGLPQPVKLRFTVKEATDDNPSHG